MGQISLERSGESDGNEALHLGTVWIKRDNPHKTAWGTDTKTPRRLLTSAASEISCRSVTGASEAMATARTALNHAREQLWPAMTTYRAVVHQWEDSVYRDYSLITRSMGERVFANPVADTTDSLGWATITLTNGRWWATARSIDPTDPNGEWYWNAAIVGDTVFLSPQTGRRRPRY